MGARRHNVGAGLRLHRLYVDTELTPQSSFELPRAAAHHAVRVLRLADGDAVVLFDGRGGEYASRLALPGRGRVLARTGERQPVERESPLEITLVQAISSNDRMDFTIQKSVELGVAAIQPVYAARTLVRLSGEREARKLAHWQRVAISACEQCGRNRVPEVRQPVALECYRAPAEGSRILLSPSGSQRLADAASGPIVLAAGPEAGFEEEEERLLLRTGFVPVRMGPRILRTETAALAALAALNALAGDF